MSYVPLLFSVFSVPSVVNNQSNFVPCQSPHFDAIALLPSLQKFARVSTVR